MAITKEQIKAALGLAMDASDQEVIDAVLARNPQAGPNLTKIKYSPYREDAVAGQPPGKGVEHNGSRN